MESLLESVHSPDDLRTLSTSQLEDLAAEVRRLIIEVVGRNRGHLSSNLGTVELTLALHRAFDFARDRLVWDCGHQTYAHKILTGRRERFATLRQEGGVSGYADPRESAYDTFHFGHTATSVSAALGMACADKTLGNDRRTVAVIGDGAMASGMAFEALNHAGETGADLLVVLNDNTMSISRSVGAIARYLSRLRSSAPYKEIKQDVHDLLNLVPAVGRRFDALLSMAGEGLQSALTPGGLFVELGFHYYGPVNGHSIGDLVKTFEHIRRLRGPVLLHVLTEKGHGFEPARANPTRFHSSGRFELADGTLCSEEPSNGTSYSQIVGDTLCRMAREDPRIAAITAAMPDGTGLSGFAREFPDRFYDVGICEQHAVGLAGGLVRAGMRPAFAVYSTFLQRAYDQLFHDIALQAAPAVFCIDRAGVVGCDGPTHHGLNDIAYCRAMNGLVVMAPKNAAELRRMLALAMAGETPAAVRYPREPIADEDAASEAADFEVGRAEVCRRGADAAIVAYGALVPRALEAAQILCEADGIETTVINARFAQPLDLDTIVPAVEGHAAVLLAEDHSVAGGFGSAVLEALAERGVAAGHVRQAAVPLAPVAAAPRERQLALLELDGQGLAARLRRLLGQA
ncbi:MAG: 1-deoxy-D-xylulose-5-phosphate synthase [Candidatus Brocadiaceae bacterium]|nr:1-deoxy-D-xylulose-5-phosphate synthase [Candidatus Brocadiaceae bacterium]